jgi:hypothetical protein
MMPVTQCFPSLCAKQQSVGHKKCARLCILRFKHRMTWNYLK